VMLIPTIIAMLKVRAPDTYYDTLNDTRTNICDVVDPQEAGCVGSITVAIYTKTVHSHADISRGQVIPRLVVATTLRIPSNVTQVSATQLRCSEVVWLTMSPFSLSFAAAQTASWFILGLQNGRTRGEGALFALSTTTRMGDA
jgi:hypothetical protein